MNCGSYGKECIYVELPKRPRPSSAKIARLEQEIQRLRAQSQLREARAQDVVAESPSTPSSINHSVVEANHMSAGEPREDSVGVDQQQDSFSGAPSAQLVPPSDSVSYYGRTSALFEDGGPHQDSRSKDISNASQVSERTQLMLMGEATRQSKVSRHSAAEILTEIKGSWRASITALVVSTLTGLIPSLGCTFFLSTGIDNITPP
jgi:hypothetical protein